MKHIKIEKTNRGYYVVIINDEIMFEGLNVEECKNYIKRYLILELRVKISKGEQVPIKFTFFINDGKDIRKCKNDKVVKILVDDCVVEF